MTCLAKSFTVKCMSAAVVTCRPRWRMFWRVTRSTPWAASTPRISDRAARGFKEAPKRMVGPFTHDAHAATAVEYAVMLALMIVAMLPSVTLLGGRVSALYDMITNAGWSE